MLMLLLSSGEEFGDLEDKNSYRKMLARDERRFKAADKNGDMSMTKEEFTAFLHPEEFDHMRDIIVMVRLDILTLNSANCSGLSGCMNLIIVA